jgi:hypothetical protein
VGNIHYGIAADNTMDKTSIGIARDVYNRLVQTSANSRFKAPLIQVLGPNEKSLFVRYQPINIDEHSKFLFVSPQIYKELHNPETVQLKWCTEVPQAKKICFIAFDSEGIDNIKDQIHAQLESNMNNYAGFIVGQTITVSLAHNKITLIIEKIIDSDGNNVPLGQIIHSADIEYEVRTDEEAFDEHNFLIELPDEMDFGTDADAGMDIGFGMAYNDNPSNLSNNGGDQEGGSNSHSGNHSKLAHFEDEFDFIESDIGSDPEKDIEESEDFGFTDGVKEMSKKAEVAIVRANKDVASDEVLDLFHDNVLQSDVPVVAVYDQNEKGIRLWSKRGFLLEQTKESAYISPMHGKAMDFLRGGKFVTASTFFGSHMVHDARGLFIIGHITENGGIKYR